MNAAIAEQLPTTHLMLSTKLVYELGDPNSTLRATADRSGPAVLIYAGGEIDACNEHTWRHLVSEAASVVTAPGPFVIDVTGLEFMGCCAFATLADEAKRCQQRGIELRLVSCEPIVARIIDACGLSGVLPIYPTVDSALSAAARW
ncbi:anti-sigma factor antagonist [Mycobacterium timonense]|uniref:Anti-sigma factor antagonist n=1 Tax=Mycobacterium timonense TaxID=701043 RepID=A0A7I9Z7Q3_9MYCO|nr:anti-sigma factor antagonist [Mycobacterium timonense]GFG96727.1 anti-sigma factor antagonist [Mycobacterium timonense]